MPIYEYQCTRCSTEFEVKRSFNDESEVTCPICEAQGRRRFSPALIVFKGSGFYATDNRKNGSRSEELPDATRSTK